MIMVILIINNKHIIKTKNNNQTKVNNIKILVINIKTLIKNMMDFKIKIREIFLKNLLNNNNSNKKIIINMVLKQHLKNLIEFIKINMEILIMKKSIRILIIIIKTNTIMNNFEQSLMIYQNKWKNSIKNINKNNIKNNIINKKNGIINNKMKIKKKI